MRFRFMITLLNTFVLASCSSYGTNPEGPDLERLKQSPQYSETDQEFINRRPHLIREMREKNMNFGMIWEWFRGGKDRVPAVKLPEAQPNLELFTQASGDLKTIWLGHSTVLLHIHGKVVLFDPIFSGHASPFSFMVKRFQDPVTTLNELPAIDFVVISHDHYDHLDELTVKHFKETSTKFITPLGVGSHLKGWGIDASRIQELDWWQSVDHDGLQFVATPAQHFSGRDGINNNKTLWSSWVVKSPEQNVFFSGDSGYDIHFKAIGEKYGPFDLAFIENGQYDKKWQAVHLLPEEGAQAYFDLKAKVFIPIHWAMFELAFHTWYDPIVSISKISMDQKINLYTPKIGQLILVSEGFKSEDWWTPLIQQN